jgi:hypothetical protein
MGFLGRDFSLSALSAYEETATIHSAAKTQARFPEAWSTGFVGAVCSSAF